jgi:competence protein ComEC
MLQWTPYPFIRIALFFIAGIVAGVYFHQLALIPLWLVLVFLVLPLSIFTTQKRQILILKSPAWGFVHFCGFSFLGLFLVQHKHPENRPHHIIHSAHITHFEGIVSSWPEEREKTYRAIIEIRSMKEEGVWQAREGKVQVFFPKDSSHTSPVKYGDRVLFQGKMQEIDGPLNPDEFDYKTFMARQGIYFRHFAGNRYVVLENKAKNPFLVISYQLRSFYKGHFEKYIGGEQERAIVLALVLGIKDGLDYDLKEAFSAAGAMHVLAVSGLHVGLIFLALQFIFHPIRRKGKTGRWVFALLCLGLLWTYALLTGSPASVLRATTMFSVIILAEASNRKPHIFNSLALAAFILLLYDPLLITSVGFQLSFLAVFGIVYYQPIIYRKLEPGSFLGRKVWQLSSVSLAAQLATFALGILYFHRFPSYFLLSNLMVIPAASVILASGLALMTFGLFPPFGKWIGHFLDTFVWLINQGIFFIEKLPYSSLKTLYIDTAGIWLLFAIIILLSLTYTQGKAVYLKISIIPTLLFCAILIQHSKSNFQNQHLVIYRIPGYTFIEAYSGFGYQSHSLENQQPPNDKIQFHVQGHRIKSGAKQIRRLFADSNELLIWNNYSFFLLNDAGQMPENLAEEITIDYLIICSDAISDLSILPKELKFNNLVLDGSCTYRNSQKLKKQALDLNLQAYAIHTEGALIIY